jgi:hypothetical protein
MMFYDPMFYQLFTLVSVGIRFAIALLELLCAGAILARFRLSTSAIPTALGLVIFALIDLAYNINHLALMLFPGQFPASWFTYTYDFLRLGGVVGALLFTAGLIPLALSTHAPSEATQ